MSGLVNDGLRFIIGCSIRILGAVFTLAHRSRIRFFSYRQARLRQKYGVSDATPIQPYGDEVEARINIAARKKPGRVRFPVTSGSTGVPKRVLFTKTRLRLLKLVFADFYMRCCWALSIKRTGLYVFSSLTHDESLTSMLMEEERLPSYLSTLQAPYRVQCHSSLRVLRSKYGDAGVRLWILTLSNPGVLYSTNPSTISTFFDELQSDWNSCSRLVRDWWWAREGFDRDVRQIARRISSRGSSQRLASIVGYASAPPLETYAPAVHSYICWTGGYVKPFLTRLEQYLPADRYRLIPMYSMSTETVETIVDVRAEATSFLPVAPGVAYEFRDETRETETRGQGDGESVCLLKADQLQPGREYSLIVSDNYGLLRYDTRDVFLCRKRVGKLPDLFFRRRRNLEYSFTGEKLTADQVTLAFETIRRANTPQLTDQFLTCIPSQPKDDRVPHYKIVTVANKSNSVQPSLAHLSESCDQLFAEINCEYRAKRQSGRLGPVRSVSITRSDFLKLIGVSESWEAQFKFLPLYVRTWEAMKGQEQGQ